jgi:hypothetical protein
MMDLRDHTLKLQLLEQSAVEKAGLRVRLLDEGALMGKGGKDYAQSFTETLIADMADEITAAAKLGVELGAAISVAKDRGLTP